MAYEKKLIMKVKGKHEKREREKIARENGVKCPKIASMYVGISKVGIGLRQLILKCTIYTPLSILNVPLLA